MLSIKCMQIYIASEAKQDPDKLILQTEIILRLPTDNATSVNMSPAKFEAVAVSTDNMRNQAECISVSSVVFTTNLPGAIYDKCPLLNPYPAE